MNLFYITDEVFDNRSVETIHVDEICKNLSDIGHGVTLYVPVRPDFHESRGYAIEKIRAHRLFSLSFQFTLFFLLRKGISTHGPDIIYARHNYLLVVPALISRMYHIPLVLEVNGRLLDEARLIDKSFAGKVLLRSGILKLLESFSIRGAARIIVVAPSIQRGLMDEYHISSDKFTIIPNGVDTRSFTPMPREERDFISIGYIGSFYPWQGLRFMVQAAQLVLKQRPEARFRIIGKGAEEEYLRSFIKDNGLEKSIELLAAIPHDEVPKYINDLDICLCYPTRFRDGATSPFKVYEYLACSKAVVLADIAGMREEFGESVAYAAPESSDALARAIIALIDNTNERRELGKRGRSFAESRSWATVAQKVVSVCTDSITRRRHP